ncbi:UPF0235 protein [Shewanella colwelliana]|uniref:UPF0235 protein BEL05_11400 n=1 Tax=Shewanella colwelliana TaxID=23 RepID=A0A1E5IQL9_SHECO|nr:DUF167 family protein YggU [Shewanella colwelliana]MDX1280547.1 DUF167 family protein YggU [Shewanella colwelliana]OEG72864.1 YggU family protein [Shewanella colwelliana]GIU32293.1 UPF0235 protein [Shewanella colwelliana]
MGLVIEQQGDLLLKLYIQPKASRDQIIGPHGDELKVAITAPPIDGKANAHLSKLLAKMFKVPKSHIIIEKGALGRHKQIKVLSPKLIPAEVAALMT